MPLSVTRTDSSTEPPPQVRRSGFRQLVDALLTLSFAVILVRTFAIEGYMISTGSMGPTLPGYHKRVTCPSCRYEFAIGTADDPAADGALANDASSATKPAESAGLHRSTVTAVCPNCGQHSIAVGDLPRNQGDQLLVFKNAYQFRPPWRWEVAVFRNPAKPTQAYVKRIVGLPGERVAVKAGDVWINGKRARKNLAQQRAVRIPVFNHNFIPEDDAGWKPRWLPDGGWKAQGHGFVCAGTGNAAPGRPAWVTYRHWIRSHGVHDTVVKVPSERAIEFSSPSLYPVTFDEKTHELRHRGVLSDAVRDRIANVLTSQAGKALIHKLAEKSHFAPINDDYGYNRKRNGHQPVPVADLMLSCQVTLQGGIGQFAVEMTDGHGRYRLTIDAGTRDLMLHTSDSDTPVRKARLKADVLSQPLRVEVSLFDRQVIAAINGHALFDPLVLPELPDDVKPPVRPARFGAAGLQVQVDDLQIYRDIYYTTKGTSQEVTLADEEYFVLGDNSPISADSRVWAEAGVHRRLFLGKPFLVHLPSRPGRFQIGKYQMRVRIPDFSRIRYIR